jgi:hypothetical protein
MKRILFSVIAAALMGLLFFVLKKAPPEADPASAAVPPSDMAAPASASASASSASSLTEVSAAVSAQPEELIDSRDILAQARAYRINLVESLNQIRSQCRSEWTREECNQQTRNYLRDRVETRDTDALLALYDRYLQYEDFLTASQPVEGQDLKGMAHLLNRARGMYFDDQTRGWLFGAEDARLGWEIARQDFLADPPDELSPRQRVEAYEALRKKHLGRYAALFTLKENPLEDIEAKLGLLAPEGVVRPEDSTTHRELTRQRLDAMARVRR